MLLSAARFVSNFFFSLIKRKKFNFTVYLNLKCFSKNVHYHTFTLEDFFIFFGDSVTYLFLFVLVTLQSSGVGTPVILHIDENGFFLYWTDQTTKVKEDFLLSFSFQVYV